MRAKWRLERKGRVPRAPPPFRSHACTTKVLRYAWPATIGLISAQGDPRCRACHHCEQDARAPWCMAQRSTCSALHKLECPLLTPCAAPGAICAAAARDAPRFLAEFGWFVTASTDAASTSEFAVFARTSAAPCGTRRLRKYYDKQGTSLAVNSAAAEVCERNKPVIQSWHNSCVLLRAIVR